MKKLLFVLFFLPLVVSSQIPEPEKNTYVNDQYGYLHDSEKAALNQQLRYIEDSTGVQVAIILIPVIPEKYSIEDYAREIGRKWNVGNAKNGIVYVAAIDQKKMRMEVANHLEGTIPDITASRLLMITKTYFRTQQYGEGILHMVSELQVVLKTGKEKQLKLTADELKKKKAQTVPVWVVLLIIPVFFGLSSFVLFRIIRKRREAKRQAEHDAMVNRLNTQLQVEKRSYELAAKAVEDHKANQEKRYNKYGQPITLTNIISDDPVILTPPPEIIYTPPTNRDNDNSSGSSSGSGYSSGSSGSSDSGYSGGSNGSSDSGSWGSGSSASGSSSSDSGYSGGGASDSW